MEMLKNLVKEIEFLQEAKTLLEKVYLEIGPYQDGRVSRATWSEVKKYFKFDDSE